MNDGTRTAPKPYWDDPALCVCGHPRSIHTESGNECRAMIAEDEIAIYTCADCTGFEPSGECDGSSECIATRHVHGCFADVGNCDEPDEYHGGRYEP